MSREITLPLASIVAAARKGLPQTTGATARAERIRSRPACHVVLADVSGSMAESAAGRRKIDVLAEAMQSLPATHSIVAFSSYVTPIATGYTLPAPSGGTALHLALDHCHAIDATHILVISDGHPDSAASALAAADRLHARIDIIYCGPDNDMEGITFMRRLARGGGAAHHHSLSDGPRLVAAVKQLALPKA